MPGPSAGYSQLNEVKESADRNRFSVKNLSKLYWVGLTVSLAKCWLVVKNLSGEENEYVEYDQRIIVRLVNYLVWLKIQPMDQG